METITRSPYGHAQKPTSGGLDSKALAKYARRAVWRANVAVGVAIVAGALAGYSLVVLYNAYAAMAAMVAAYGLVLPHPPIIPYMGVAMPVAVGLLFGLLAANKTEEAAFRSQLAMHILHLQDLLQRDKEEHERD